MKKVTIYHNPRCSKSREALDLLKEKGFETEVIKYLETPLTKKELKDLLMKLNMKPLDIIRQKEALFQENYKGKKFTDAEWLQIIIENPVLLERPIVVKGYKAIVARPAGLLETLLK